MAIDLIQYYHEQIVTPILQGTKPNPRFTGYLPLQLPKVQRFFNNRSKVGIRHSVPDPRKPCHDYVADLPDEGPLGNGELREMIRTFKIMKDDFVEGIRKRFKDREYLKSLSNLVSLKAIVQNPRMNDELLADLRRVMTILERIPRFRNLIGKGSILSYYSRFRKNVADDLQRRGYTLQKLAVMSPDDERPIIEEYVRSLVPGTQVTFLVFKYLTIGLKLVVSNAPMLY